MTQSISLSEPVNSSIPDPEVNGTPKRSSRWGRHRGFPVDVVPPNCTSRKVIRNLHGNHLDKPILRIGLSLARANFPFHCPELT